LSVTQQQVLDALARVMSPRGIPLTEANALSEITANDGKVFFSINVEASEARAWESVRAQAEAALKKKVNYKQKKNKTLSSVN
jgi:ATP-binding protein involved in chromosome partitioning